MNNFRCFDYYTLKRLRSYVYALIDPMSDEIFYVGKGGGDEDGNQRIFSHFYEAERLQNSPQKQSRKIKKILDIWNRNQDVKWEILRHGINSTEAHEVEAAIIDSLNIPAKRLLNVVVGHNSARGILTLDDIRMMSALPVRPGKSIKVFVFQIHKHQNIAGNFNISAQDVYEATRRAWRIGKQYRNNTDDYYAVGVVQNVSIGAYKIDHWMQDNDQPTKCVFWKSEESDPLIIKKLLYKNWSKPLSEAKGFLQHGGGSILVEFNEKNQFRILKGTKDKENSWTDCDEATITVENGREVEADSEVNIGRDVENILPIIQSDQARKRIKEGSLDFPGSECLDGWNTLPMGKAAACKDKLMVFITDEKTAFEIVAQALCQVGHHCRSTTKLVVFSVDIKLASWNNIWNVFFPAFEQLYVSDALQCQVQTIADSP